MSVRDPFDAIYELGQSEVDNKPSLQFLEPQVRQALRRINGIVRPRLAFDDHGVVNKDIDAKRMLRIAEVASFVDNRTRCFKLSFVPMRLKFICKRTLVGLFEYARPSKRLVDLYGARDDVLGDVSVLSGVVFHVRNYTILLQRSLPYANHSATQLWTSNSSPTCI